MCFSQSQFSPFPDRIAVQEAEISVHKRSTRGVESVPLLLKRIIVRGPSQSEEEGDAERAPLGVGRSPDCSTVTDFLRCYQTATKPNSEHRTRGKSLH